jgi:hypothetical protein
MYSYLEKSNYLIYEDLMTCYNKSVVILGTQLNKSCAKNLGLQNIDAYGTHNYLCALESFKTSMTNKQLVLRCVTCIHFAQMETVHTLRAMFMQEMLIYGYTSSDT